MINKYHKFVRAKCANHKSIHHHKTMSHHSSTNVNIASQVLVSLSFNICHCKHSRTSFNNNAQSPSRHTLCGRSNFVHRWSNKPCNQKSHTSTSSTKNNTNVLKHKRVQHKHCQPDIHQLHWKRHPKSKSPSLTHHSVCIKLHWHIVLHILSSLQFATPLTFQICKGKMPQPQVYLSP